MAGELDIAEQEYRRWKWERHGEGWALYQGRTALTHGYNRLWVADAEFDSMGQQLRERIATLLNGDEGI